MDCGVIILWLPAELEDVQSADMSERGVWNMCGDSLGWIFLCYYNLLRLFVHILRFIPAIKLVSFSCAHLRDTNTIIKLFYFFLYIDWILTKLCRYFLIGIPHCWKLFCFFFQLILFLQKLTQCFRIIIKKL